LDKSLWRTNPCELLLTTDDLSPRQVERFKQVCAKNEGNPLPIELAQEPHSMQPTFSEVAHVSHLEEAIAKASDCAYRLNEQGFGITSIKIEVPFTYAERCQSYPEQRVTIILNGTEKVSGIERSNSWSCVLLIRRIDPEIPK